MNVIISKDYNDFLKLIKIKIQSTRSRAALTINQEMITLYHEIGNEIIERQKHAKWGDKIIQQLAHDLKSAFPETKGFSARNIKYMRHFAESCPDLTFGQQPAAQLPWFHIVTILTKVKKDTDREWYAVQTVNQSWSRLNLEKQIKSNLLERKNKGVIKPCSNLKSVQQILKDPYIFDFLSLTDEASERDIENALVKNITQFLLELGHGFSFVGKQFRLQVNSDEFYIDLLFYHIKLKCYVVIELKNTSFKPEHIGQISFYLTVVDSQIKDKSDNPTIGILLCKEKNQLVAQYALNGFQKSIGIAEYLLVKELPEKLANQLPSIEDLEAQLNESDY